VRVCACDDNPGHGASCSHAAYTPTPCTHDTHTHTTLLTRRLHTTHNPPPPPPPQSRTASKRTRTVIAAEQHTPAKTRKKANQTALACKQTHFDDDDDDEHGTGLFPAGAANASSDGAAAAAAAPAAGVSFVDLAASFDAAAAASPDAGGAAPAPVADAKVPAPAANVDAGNAVVAAEPDIFAMMRQQNDEQQVAQPIADPAGHDGRASFLRVVGRDTWAGKNGNVVVAVYVLCSEEAGQGREPHVRPPTRHLGLPFPGAQRTYSELQLRLCE
jgi:hypothetical protein